MDYITNYYKNLSEQLQQQVDMLEATLNTPADIRQREGRQSKRAYDREDRISAMLGLLTDTTNGVNHKAVHRVLRDAMGLEGGNASREDLQHVMAHIRKDYYLGSEDPQEQRLDAARQRTLRKNG
jgi:hypothetical protein